MKQVILVYRVALEKWAFKVYRVRREILDYRERKEKVVYKV